MKKHTLKFGLATLILLNFSSVGLFKTFLTYVERVRNVVLISPSSPYKANNVVHESSVVESLCLKHLGWQTLLILEAFLPTWWFPLIDRKHSLICSILFVHFPENPLPNLYTNELKRLKSKGSDLEEKNTITFNIHHPKLENCYWLVIPWWDNVSLHEHSLMATRGLAAEAVESPNKNMVIPLN